MKPTIRLAVISDLHVGHQAGLWPKNFRLSKGSYISQNDGQKKMFVYWNDFWNQPEVKQSQFIINLAESIEGNNRKQAARDLMVADLNLQIRACVDLLQPRVAGRKYIAVSGSLYHDAMELDVEAIIAEQLGGEYAGEITNRQFGRFVLNLAHAPGNSMLYKSTMLDRGSLITDAIEGKWEHNKIPYHIDLIARAHIHQFFLNQNESRISYINPAWKFWHPIRAFGAKSYSYSQPTIGGTVIELGDTICVKKFTYPTVQIYDALIQERAA